MTPTTFKPRRQPSESEFAAFLHAERKSHLTTEGISAVLLLLGGVAFTWLTHFVATIVVLWYDPHIYLKYGDWIATGYVVAIFASFPARDPERLSNFEVNTLGGERPFCVVIPGGMLATNLIAGPATLNALTQLILNIAFVAPTCLAGSYRAALRALALRRASIRECVPVLALLYQQKSRVPYGEIIPAAGETPEATVSTLLLLDVVQHLPSPPQGLVISSAAAKKIKQPEVC